MWRSAVDRVSILASLRLIWPPSDEVWGGTMARWAMRTGTAIGLLIVAVPAFGQDRGITYTHYGTPGLLEMPTALSAMDGELAVTLSLMDGQQRTALTFQITPRLSGTFRISGTKDYSYPGDPAFDGIFIDRGFDLRYQILDESARLPALAIGLQDFLGSGHSGAEYVVATKAVSDSIRVTAGLGWGRLGSNNGFSNPFGILGDSFDTRSPSTSAMEPEEMFQGDAALFGGVEWAFADNWTIKAEYSSDAYVREADLGLISIDSPLNFGLTWEPLDGVQIGASYLYGNTFGLAATILMNPNDRPMDGGFDSAPVPVSVRPADLRAMTSWNRSALPDEALAAGLAQAMESEGLILSGIEVTDTTTRLRYTNTRYRSEAQAMGRLARMLTQGLPPSIELITLEPMKSGIPVSAVTLRRSDLEALETSAGGSETMFDRAGFADAGSSAGLLSVAPSEGPFSWSLGPYLGLVFGPEDDDGLALNGGVEVTATYAFSPNFILGGAVRQQLFNTSDTATFVPDNDVPGVHPVRRNAPLYALEGTTTIPMLTLAHFARPGPNLYSRVTAGLLEPMYGGVSTELLFKPVDSAWGFGAEVNYVQQRDFDQQFSFRDYDVVTGHGSLYYDFDSGFYAQLDVGRYLAGDWGATMTLDRTFENGWRVGASATVTEVSFDSGMSEGVDYGIRVTIPVDFVLGQPSQRGLSTTLGAPTRDDGQRLDVDGRLYDTVRSGHLSDLEDGWGRFWR